MRYEIIHSTAGRVRLRCGKWMFTQDEANGVREQLLESPAVTEVVIRPANGSILVHYEGDGLSAVLDAVDNLDACELPVAQADETNSLAVIDNRFQLQIASKIGWRVFRRLFVPLPVRHALTLVGGLRYLGAGLRALSRGRLTVEVLDATAITASLLRREFGMASEVMFMLRLSEALADYTQARTRCALRNNLALYASKAWVIRDGVETEVPVETIEAGSLVRVRTGSLIPLDGTVVEGEGSVNEASMTGESALVSKRDGDTVYAGTVVDDGSIVIRSSNEAGESRIDAIVSMVESSESTKASAQSHAEKLADSMVPFSLGLFLLELVLTRNVNKAISVLMVDYSCAIKLATPIAVMSAMREGVRGGVVAKGGKYLESYAAADTIVFDKTGTLTSASPEVEKVLCFNGIKEDELLRMAACLEEHFPHSMARAIVRSAHKAGLHHKEENHAEVEYIVAHGIASKVEGKDIRLGSAHFIFDDEGVERPKDLTKCIEKEAPAASTVFVAVDGKLVGALCISDPLRPEAAEVIQSLRDRGFKRVVMLTGDSENCARVVSERLGLDEYHAQVLPEDKAHYVEELKRQGCVVAMVGDGINDSPALAAADVSLTLSDASDIARSVADISVMRAHLGALVTTRDLASGLMKRIDDSHRFIVTFNTGLILLGALGLLQPAASATLHNASTVALSALNTRPVLKGAACYEGA